MTASIETLADNTATLISKHTGVPKPHIVKGRQREGGAVLARYMLFTILHDTYRYRSTQIADALGWDQKAIWHGINIWKLRLGKDPKFFDAYANVILDIIHRRERKQGKAI